MPGAANPSVLVCGTGMVRLPAPRGGAVESYVHDILQMFDGPDDGPTHWNVRAVSDWLPGYEFADRCVPVHSPIDRYPLPPYVSAFAHAIGGVLTARAIMKNIRSSPPDVLHVNEELTIRLCRNVGTKKILTLHSPSEFLLRFSHSHGRSNGDAGADGRLNALLRRADWMMVRDALSSYDAIVVLTSFAKQVLAGLGVSSTVIPLPVNTERYFPVLDGGRSEPRTLLFVGRLERRKNPQFLLHVLARLPLDVRVVLVGRGPEEPAIRALCARLGLIGRVAILPTCSPSKLADLYRNAAVFVFPSRIEAYGKVLNEALASGVPVVVPQSKVYYDLIREGVALTFSDVDECVDAVRLLLDHTELRRAIATKARHVAMTKLSYRSIRKRLADLYGIYLPNSALDAARSHEPALEDARPLPRAICSTQGPSRSDEVACPGRACVSLRARRRAQVVREEARAGWTSEMRVSESASDPRCTRESFSYPTSREGRRAWVVDSQGGPESGHSCTRRWKIHGPAACIGRPLRSVEEFHAGRSGCSK